MMKRMSRGFYIFIEKNEGCDVSLSIPYVGPSFSRGHQTLTIKNLKIYCLNASVKYLDARRTNIADDDNHTGTCQPYSEMLTSRHF